MIEISAVRSTSFHFPINLTSMTLYVLFHKAVNNYIPLNIPPYLKLFEGETQLRSTLLDNFCYTSNIIPKSSSSSLLKKSFFYRTNSWWSSLPLEIHSLVSVAVFRTRLEKYFWHNILTSYVDGDAPDGVWHCIS